MSVSVEFRNFFENLVTEIHDEGFKITSDQDVEGKRIVTFEKYQIIVTIIQNIDSIDYDIYANLKSGIYEIGDLHLITRKMLNIKKICMKYNGREMNTTERLYPTDRQGSNTRTSGL